MTEIDDDTEALLMKRVYDMAGTVKDCKVFLNDERIKIKGFKQYIDMYLSATTKKQSEESGGAAVNKPAVVYEVSKDGRWEVGFAVSDGQPQQVSFANSISTIKGGTHVDAVSNYISNQLMDQIKKKNKAAPVKPHQIKNHMWIFVNALVENPAFDSQTKETLTLRQSAFGSKLALSDEFIKKGR
jgi:DNA topoisomerase-2